MNVKEITLPFEEKPFSVMYHYTAFPLGIVQANMEPDKIDRWLCTKYINCSFEPCSKMNKFNIGRDLWLTDEKILIRHKNIFSKAINDYYKIDVVKIFKDMINQGSYPQGNYNEEWIPDKFAYQKYRFYHDYLLIGCNDAKQVFYSVGFLQDKKFQKFEIPYTNMKKAVETLFNDYIGIDLLEYNARKIANMSITFDYTICELTDYINSANRWRAPANNAIFYGLKAILKFCDYVKEEVSKSQIIETKYMRGVMEHKFFMYKRIKYMLEHGYIESGICLSCAEKVYKLSEKAHLLTIKYLMTGKSDIVNSIEELLKQTLEIEKNYLPIVVDELKSSTGGT